MRKGSHTDDVWRAEIKKDLQNYQRGEPSFFEFSVEY